MTERQTTRVFTSPPGGLPRHCRCIITDGVLAKAGADDIDFGSTLRDTTTSPTNEVGLDLNGYVTIVIASGAITKFSKIYQAADGKVSASGTIVYGYALQGAAADGDEIEVVHVGAGAASAGYFE